MQRNRRWIIDEPVWNLCGTMSGAFRAGSNHFSTRQLFFEREKGKISGSGFSLVTFPQWQESLGEMRRRNSFCCARAIYGDYIYCGNERAHRDVTKTGASIVERTTRSHNIVVSSAPATFDYIWNMSHRSAPPRGNDQIKHFDLDFPSNLRAIALTKSILTHL